jgi:NACalpha-BTF3-like transcription factor
MATRSKNKKTVESTGDSLASLLGMDESVPTVIEPYKVQKLSPFDFINAISYTKENLITDETVNQYLPFIVNNGLSQYQDTVVLANYVNCRPHIPNKGQFYFLINTVTKRKRFDKWCKSIEVENLDLVMEYYNCSRSKAISALKILSEENIAMIRHKTRKGGNDGQTK